MSNFKSTPTGAVHNHRPNTSDISNTTYVNLVRNVKLPSGTTYRYVFSTPFDSDKPYLLFLHGFPEASYGWHHQITYFTNQGFGIIVPDLLGYGGTDNPFDLHAFSFKRMAADIVDLLDGEGVDRVVGIAHDLGAPLLSRLINSHSARLSAVVFLNNGYFAPQAKLDAPIVDAVNTATLAHLGYQALGFWLFFNEENASKVLNQHQESFHTIAYTRNTSVWREHFAPPGSLQQWLEHDKVASDLCVSSVDLDQWKRIMNAQGGFDGPLKWFKAIMRGINNPDETDLNLPGNISQPLLLIVADRDPVALAPSQLNDTLPYASNIRVRTVDTGHFMQLEAPHEINRHLDRFLQDVMKIPALGPDSITISFEGSADQK